MNRNATCVDTNAASDIWIITHNQGDANDADNKVEKGVMELFITRFHGRNGRRRACVNDVLWDVRMCMYLCMPYHGISDTLHQVTQNNEIKLIKSNIMSMLNLRRDAYF